MKPNLFIVGLPRTASKLIQNSLNAYSEYCILHEMHIFNPLHPHLLLVMTWYRLTGRIGQLMSNTERWLSKEFFGSYWRAYTHQYTIFMLDENVRAQALRKSRTPMQLMTNMMQAQMQHYNKISMGVRHPVHFTLSPLLLMLFGDAKMIFLQRGYKDILRSQVAKRIKTPGLFSLIRRLLLSILVGIQVLLAKIVMLICSLSDRFIIVSYESLISDTDQVFKKICVHLDIEYDEQMSDLSHRYDSSFDKASEAEPDYKIHWVNKNQEL